MNGMMLNRSDAYSLLNNYVKSDKIYNHSLAVEAIMRNLSKRFKEDEEIWGLVGLLHDVDYEYTQENPEKHGIVAAQILNGLLPSAAVNAIQSHNYIHTEVLPTTILDKCLLASDAVSGLIIATALIIPSRKIAEIQLSTLIDKFNDKSFAKGCSRERIKLCSDCDISLNEFLQLSLDALCDISDKIGL